MSANFIGNTLTQSEAIDIYTPYDVTSSRPQKKLHFCQFWRDRKIILCAGPELKFENYESVQHRLQFSGIKKGAKISFHGHFNKGNKKLKLISTFKKFEFFISFVKMALSNTFLASIGRISHHWLSSQFYLTYTEYYVH